MGNLKNDIYIGYLYQINPKAKSIHGWLKSFDNSTYVETPGRYVLYTKHPFKPGVVVELITGKQIPIVALGIKHLIGVHTFIRLNSKIRNVATIASKVQIEQYMRANPSKEEYSKYLNKIFEIGLQKKKNRSELVKNEKDVTKNTRKKYMKLMKNGEYQKIASEIPKDTSIEFETEVVIQKNRQSGSMDISRVNGPMGMPLVVPMNGQYPGQLGGPVFGTPYMTEADLDRGSGEEVSQKSSNYFGLEEFFQKTRKEQKLEKERIKKEIEHKKELLRIEEEKKAALQENSQKSTSKMSSEVPVQNYENNTPKNSASNVASLESTPKKIIEQDNVINNNSHFLPKATNQVSLNNLINDKSKIVISSLGRNSTEVIKELAQIAGKGGEAVATIEGVEVSTKYLVNEKDLTEYFLAKRYNRTPESMTVKAVLANEESMNIINKSRSL